VLSLDTPDEENAEVQIESFFDDMAFQAAESAPRGEAAGSWSVQESKGPPPLPGDTTNDGIGDGSDGDKPIGVVDDDDIPVVMGNDLPVAVGRTPTPAKNDPFSGLDWVVGEPGKK
jgi:hypothetical protein